MYKGHHKIEAGCGTCGSKPRTVSKPKPQTKPMIKPVIKPKGWGKS